MPHTAVAHLGERYAARFYDYVAISPTENTFIVPGTGLGDIQAACIVSLDPSSLIRRLWHHTSLLYAVVTHLTDPAIVGVARALSPWKSTPRRHSHDDAPEITSIFTAPDRLRCGLGTQLLARCEDFLAASGHTRYTVQTADVESNTARFFFASVGFLEIKALTAGVLRLEKRLSSVDSRLSAAL